MTSVLAGADEGVALDGCAVCELSGLEFSRPTRVGDLIAVYSDRDVVVFMQPAIDGVFVAPPNHVENISGFDASTMGRFLASLRRVTIQVSAIFGGSGPAISSDSFVLPCSVGHVSFLAAPTRRRGTGKRTFPGDPMILAERLATGLQ